MSTAIDFLKAFDPDGWHNLVAIKPDPIPDVDEPVGVTIAPGQWDKAEAFVAAHEGKNNLYFSVNEPKPNSPDKKLKKINIGNIRAIYADVDPGPGDLDQARKAIRQRADQALTGTPPNLIIDSGGGLQFFWQTEKLAVDEATQARAERQARGIAYLMEGDGVCNIDRIMRLPGTHNIPGKKKLARGRKVALATVMNHKPFTTDLEALAKAYKPLDAPEGDDTSEEITALMGRLDMGYVKGHAGYADLPEDLRERFDRDCAYDEPLARLWSGEAAPEDTSSSGWRFALAKAVKSHGGYSADEFGALCWVWDKSDPDKITPRTVARDWLRAAKGPEDFFEILPDDKSENLSKSKKFVFEDFIDVAAADLDNPPLIKGLLDQGAMSVLYGDSNTGKTFVAMDIGFHVGTGAAYAGMRTAPGLVVYVAAEGGRGARKRLVALRERFPGQAPAFKLLASPVNLLDEKADLVPLCQAIIALGQPVALLVIDTLSRAMAGGDENSSTDMGRLVKHLDLLRKGLNPAHLMVVHHSGKDRARGARGHSLLRAATDTEIEVAKPDDGPRTISVKKQRDMDGEWLRSFKLRVHTLGLDADGDPITSCTVDLLTDGEARAVRAVPTEKERDVLSALAAASAGREGAISTRDVAAAYSDDASEKVVSAIRQHLRNLYGKGLVAKPRNGFWTVLGVGKGVLHFENLDDDETESVESVEKVEGGIFD